MEKEYKGSSHFSLKEEEFLEKLLTLCKEYQAQIDSDYGNIEVKMEEILTLNSLSVTKNSDDEYQLECEIYPNPLFNGTDRLKMTLVN